MTKDELIEKLKKTRNALKGVILAFSSAPPLDRGSEETKKKFLDNMNKNLEAYGIEKLDFEATDEQSES